MISLLKFKTRRFPDLKIYNETMGRSQALSILIIHGDAVLETEGDGVVVISSVLQVNALESVVVEDGVFKLSAFGNAKPCASKAMEGGEGTILLVGSLHRPPLRYGCTSHRVLVATMSMR